MSRDTRESNVLPTPLVHEIMPDRVLQIIAEQPTPEPRENMKYPHYFKDVSHLEALDIYRICLLYNVTDPCIQHALKKLLVAGGRGAGKDIAKDIQESIDALERWKAMRAEDSRPAPIQNAGQVQ